MKRILALGAAMAALGCSAGPALAGEGSDPAQPSDIPTAPASVAAINQNTTQSGQSQTGGQSTDQSVGTVQVEQASVSPSAAVNAPVNANAPVTVASSSAGGNASQSGGDSSASSASGSPSSGEQTVNESAATVQASAAGANPSVSANAPANANAPVCVASTCSGSSSTQASSGAGSTTSSSGGNGSQDVTHSVGSAQVGSAGVNPAISGNAPVTANAPVCVASDCTGGSSTQSSGGSGSTSNSAGNGGGPQDVSNSLGSAQVGPVGANPAVSGNAPINGNVPVCVLSTCAGGNSTQASGGTGATTSSSGGNGSQDVTHSVGSAQVGSVGVNPAISGNAPVTANAPVCVASDCSGGSSTQSSGGTGATTSASGGGGSQDVNHSAVTVQVGSVAVNPAASGNAPIDGNVPVCVLSTCAGGNSTQSPGGSSTTTEASGGSEPQAVDGSLGTVQIGSVNVAPAAARNTPAGGNVPICVASTCAGGITTQASGSGPGLPPATNETTTSSSSTSIGSTGPSSVPPAPSPGKGPLTASPTSKPAPHGTTTTRTGHGTPQHLPKPGSGIAKRQRSTAAHSGTKPGNPHVLTSTPTNRTVVKGVLPFTGLGLTLFLLIALGLVGLGIGVRFGAGKEVTAA